MRVAVLDFKVIELIRRTGVFFVLALPKLTDSRKSSQHLRALFPSVLLKVIYSTIPIARTSLFYLIETFNIRPDRDFIPLEYIQQWFSW